VNFKHLTSKPKQQVDGASPIGFRVPSLPRFEINEKLAVKITHQAETTQAEFLSALAVIVVFAAALGVILFTKVGATLV
jgi:hypothetical protein